MKPILFNTEMVRAILDGRKTQTRRAINRQPPSRWRAISRDGDSWSWSYQIPALDFHTVKCPYGKPGDLLWVRETWGITGKEHHFHGTVPGVQYKAGGNVKYEGVPFDTELTEKWKPSIHMPKWACRLFLKIKNIRVERIQDISQVDMEKEGLYMVKGYLSELCEWRDSVYGIQKTRTKYFKKLWNSINEKRGFGWGVNPWVWVVEFERTEA